MHFIIPVGLSLSSYHWYKLTKHFFSLFSGLTWSQEGEDFALHAMPIMHHTNVSQACSMLDGVTAYEASVYEQALAEYDDTGTSDDWDFGVDCGDFMM